MADVHTLQDQLGNRVIVDPAEIAPYCGDSSRATPVGTPLALVHAESTSDVSLALAWANEARVPVSVRGAGSGLAGGANSYDGGLIISLARMNRVIEIDAANGLAEVQPGVITADLDAVAAQHGLFFAPDPASARISSVGGNIATNAGGLRCVAHGVTADSVAGLEVVLADGRVMRTGARTRKNVVGYDLTRLFIGSEGTLGVITSALVRLKPLPEGAPYYLRATFPSLESAGRAVTAIVGSALRPEVLELIDALGVEMLNDHFARSSAGQSDTPALAAGTMLISQTVGEDAQAQAALLARVCEQYGATETEVSLSDAPLEARRLAFSAMIESGLKLACDIGVPVSRLVDVFEGIDQLAAQHGLRVSTIAHAGDGNLHSAVETRDTPGGVAAAEALLDDITRLALKLGGTITGEHGIGSTKHHELGWQLDETVMWAQHAIKQALDPNSILTPGRAI